MDNNNNNESNKILKVSKSALYQVGYPFVALFADGSRHAKSIGTLASRVFAWMKRGLLNPGGKLELNTDSEDPHYRFEFAVDAYGHNEESLRAMKRGLKVRAAAMLGLSAALVLWGLWLQSNMFSDIFHVPSMPIGLAVILWLVAKVAAMWPVVMSMSLFFKYAFGHWQIRRRRLDSFGQFLRSPAEWLPFSISRSAAFSISILVLGLLSLNPAFAVAQVLPSDLPQVSNADVLAILSRPDVHDLFYQMLEYMLGGADELGPLTGDTDAAALSPYKGPLAYAAAGFNLALMMLATIVVSWQTVGGMVSTATTGQVLGGKYHQIWAPVRVTVGIGMLAPVAGGFCGAQIVLLWLVVGGSNLANVVWDTYLSYFEGSMRQNISEAYAEYVPSDMSHQHATAQGGMIARSFAEKELCWAAIAHLNRAAAAAEERSPLGLSNTFARTHSGPSYQSMITTYAEKQMKTVPVGDDGSEYVWDYGPACGKITFDYAAYARNIQADSFFGSAAGDMFSDIAEVRNRLGGELMESLNKNLVNLEDWAEGFVRIYTMTKADQRELNKALQERFALIPVDAKALSDRIQSEGAGIVAKFSFPAAIDQFVDILRQDLQLAPANAYEEIRSIVGREMSDGFLTDAKQRGWVIAGGYYYLLSRLQSVTATAMNFQPNATPMDMEMIRGNFQTNSLLLGAETATASSFGFEGVMRIFFDQFDTVSRDALYGDAYANTTKVLKVNDDDIVSELMRSGLNDLLESVGYLDPARPLEAMVDLGHQVIEVGYAAITAMAVLKGGMEIASGEKGGALGFFASMTPVGAAAAAASVMLAPLMQIFSFLIYGIFIMGVVHAYILPFIPVFYWFMFLVGMAILTVEAFMAAPIWAFMHIRMEGEEFVDQVQRPGYMICFNVLLRPALGVLAIILSYTVFGALAYVVNKILPVAINSIVAGQELEIIGMAVMLGVVLYIHWQIALRSFGMMVSMPDRVARWFGQGGENLNEEQDTNRAMAFFINHSENKLAGLGGRVAGKVGGGRGQAYNGGEGGKGGGYEGARPISGGGPSRQTSSSDDTP